MAILKDIERLGLELEDADRDEIDKLIAKISEEKKDDPFVRDALIEYAITEFLCAWKPEVVDALAKDKERQNDEWVRQTQRKFDEKGARICDEPYCASTTGVAQCSSCGKHICSEHNYGEDSRSCYDCWLIRYKESQKKE